MTARGKVVVLSEGGEAAVVRVFREAACGGDCPSCGLCGGKAIDVKVSNKLRAKPGDIVEIEGDSGKTLLLCFFVYPLPAMLFVFGWLIHPAAGIAFAILSVAVVLLANRRLRAAGGLKMEIARVFKQS